jgi:hypothetical protein
VRLGLCGSPCFISFAVKTSFSSFVLIQSILGDRCLHLGLYGLMLDGPIGHLWYKLLDSKVHPDKPKSTAAVLIKTAADQIVWAPIMTVGRP